MAQGGAKVLFDGKSLGAWEPIGDANWTIVEGAVQATGGKGGHLVSKEQFGDFELSAEFWVESPKTNSGIFIRCQDTHRSVPRPATRSISGTAVRSRISLPVAS